MMERYFEAMLPAEELEQLKFIPTIPEFYKMATSYLTANAIIGSAAAKMAQLNREEAAKAAEMTRFYSHYMSEKQLADKVGIYIMCDDVIGAYEFLNKSLRNEIIHDCQNQKAFKTHLPNLIEERKKKYRSFYQKLDMPMPSVIKTTKCIFIGKVLAIPRKKRGPRALSLCFCT